jgi:hypothetical protein
MAEPTSTPFWPLFDLVVRTPRLEMRLPREDEFGALIALVDAGIHDPATMPFTTPFTDVPAPRRARESAQFWWRQRSGQPTSGPTPGPCSSRAMWWACRA